MTRGKGTQKKILSISEREGLISEKKDLETNLKDASQYGGGQVNTGVIKQQINNLDKALHDGMAPKVAGIKKDALWAEAKQLKEEIMAGMPTQFEMDHPGRAPGAVGKHMNWDKRNADKIRRYKEIMRMLEPQDPTAGMYDSWRASGRPRD
jgi:hypothetical protein